jgi:SAM-dependent methyltransferase
MSWRAFKFYLFHPIIAVRRLGNMIYEWQHPDEPWLAPAAVRFLDEHLKSEMTLFEWGSGRSTFWFADRVRSVVSIEYHEQWAQKISRQIKERGQSNIDLRYVPLDHPLKVPTPKHYDPLPRYVDVIHEFSKESFDVIVVDGHYRLTCVDQCLDYLKPGGYLVIDNSNRSSKDEWSVPKGWPLVHESENVMTRTSLWQKK